MRRWSALLLRFIATTTSVLVGDGTRRNFPRPNGYINDFATVIDDTQAISRGWVQRIPVMKPNRFHPDEEWHRTKKPRKSTVSFRVMSAGVVGQSDPSDLIDPMRRCVDSRLPKIGETLGPFHAGRIRKGTLTSMHFAMGVVPALTVALTAYGLERQSWPIQ